MKKIMYVIFVLGVFFLSCGKDNASGTAPRKPITRADLYPENGYISGTISGKNSEGVSFVKAFNHQLDEEMATYYVNEAGDYVIHLSKLDKYGRVGEEDKKTDITLTLEDDMVSLKSLTGFYISIYIDSSATSITKFNIDQSGLFSQSSLTRGITLSNVVFNVTDGTFNADYTLSVASTRTSSEYTATVTNGKISTTLTNIRYRTGS